MEDVLQNKSNEFTNKLTAIQHDHEQEMKVKIDSFSVKHTSDRLFKEHLTTIQELKSKHSNLDAKLTESNGIVTNLYHENEVLASAKLFRTLFSCLYC